jgi:hypothetical protein
MARRPRAEYTDGVTVRMLQVFAFLIENHPGVPTMEYLITTMMMSNSAPQRWKQGIGVPTVENICYVCHHYSVSPEWILMGSGEMFRTDEQMERQFNWLEKVLATRKKPGKTDSNLHQNGSQKKAKQLKVR